MICQLYTIVGHVVARVYYWPLSPTNPTLFPPSPSPFSKTCVLLAGGVRARAPAVPMPCAGHGSPEGHRIPNTACGAAGVAESGEMVSAAAGGIPAAVGSSLTPSPSLPAAQARGDADHPGGPVSGSAGVGVGDGWGCLDADASPHPPVAGQDAWLLAAGEIGGAGGLLNFGPGANVGGGGGGQEGAGGVGDGVGEEEGGVEWVVQGGEAIAEADEAAMPLVAEIRLRLTRNFAHFFQV